MNQHQPHPPAQHDPQVGPATTARLVLRYRPAADVLIGAIELPTTANGTERVEQPDADTRLYWRDVNDGPLTGQAVLQSFEIIHAHTRWQQHRGPALPAVLCEAGRQFTDHEHHQHLGLPLAARYTARTESTLTVPLHALTRVPSTEEPLEQGSRRDAVRVARALDRFAEALEAQQSRSGSPRTGSLEHQRTITFCSSVRELGAAILHHHTLAAPGNSAAARSALRGGVPLGSPDRDTLRLALTDIDRPDRWGLVAAAVEQLTTSLARPSKSPKGTPLD